jgi:hypothetical protein
MQVHYGFTKAHHWSLYSVSSAQSSVFMSSFPKINFNIILSTTPGLPSGFSPWHIQNKVLNVCLNSLCVLHIQPSHPSWFKHPNNNIWQIYIRVLLFFWWFLSRLTLFFLCLCILSTLFEVLSVYLYALLSSTVQVYECYSCTFSCSSTGKGRLTMYNNELNDIQ